MVPGGEARDIPFQERAALNIFWSQIS